jgi:hypothetical protein
MQVTELKKETEDYFWDFRRFRKTSTKKKRAQPSTPNAIFTPTLYSLIVPVLGSRFAVIWFTSSPVISLIVFFASSNAAWAASVHPRSELPTVLLFLLS